MPYTSFVLYKDGTGRDSAKGGRNSMARLEVPLTALYKMGTKVGMVPKACQGA